MRIGRIVQDRSRLSQDQKKRLSFAASENGAKLMSGALVTYQLHRSFDELDSRALLQGPFEM